MRENDPKLSKAEFAGHLMAKLEIGKRK